MKKIESNTPIDRRGAIVRIAGVALSFAGLTGFRACRLLRDRALRGAALNKREVQ